MEKPWFKLDPNNLRDRWWLYTSIVDVNTCKKEKNDFDILCYLILQEQNMGDIFYRVSVWFKDDPNRYTNIMNDYNWIFNKKLNEMNEGDIVNTYGLKFKVYNCRYSAPNQIDMCKILERIEE